MVNIMDFYILNYISMTGRYIYRDIYTVVKYLIIYIEY